MSFEFGEAAGFGFGDDIDFDGLFRDEDEASFGGARFSGGTFGTKSVESIILDKLNYIKSLDDIFSLEMESVKEVAYLACTNMKELEANKELITEGTLYKEKDSVKRDTNIIGTVHIMSCNVKSKGCLDLLNIRHLQELRDKCRNNWAFETYEDVVTKYAQENKYSAIRDIDENKVIYYKVLNKDCITSIKSVGTL